MTRNGLKFYTGCNTAIGNTDESVSYFNSVDADTFEDCMNSAATFQPLCYAVTFDDGTCYGWGADLYPLNTTGKAAVAGPTQIKSPDDEGLECPYDPNSYITTNSTQEEFQLICGQDFNTGTDSGGDFCSWDTEDAQCHGHADTLMECMELCSQAHPLCKGVTWNPDMKGGWGNCYLKSNPGATKDPSDETAHSALVTGKLYTDLNTDCPSTSTYDKDGNTYSLSCNTGRAGSQNFTSVRSNSLDDCLQKCSSETGQRCLGVLVDMGLEDGFENCYLLNATGQALTGGANMTFAEVTASQKSAASSDQSANNQDRGASKAWIAGPVIGVLAVIAIVAGGWYCWRRRRQNRHTNAAKAWQADPDYGSGKSEGQSMLVAPHDGYGERTNPQEKYGEPVVPHEKYGEPVVPYEKYGRPMASPERHELSS